ncbi:uncharacterized protein [Mytilus edulis]|uniref:uncharacterized protein n=1 Tax=Mytilus edulis TaxID=6550 RepID=UPI0039F11B26
MSNMITFVGLCMVLLCLIESRKSVAQDFKEELFCEYTDHLNISCPEKRMVVINDITMDGLECQKESDKDVCQRNYFSKLRTYCVGNNNCSIPSTEVFTDNCQRTPRHIQVQYVCKCTEWYYHKKKRTICASRLSEINCDDYWFCNIIEIVDITIETENRCPLCETTEVKQSLRLLCNDKTVCLNPEDNELCLFHQRSIKVKYWCKEENNILPDWSTSFEYTMTPTSINISSLKPTSSSIDVNRDQTSPLFETSSLTITRTTFPIEEQPNILIDFQGQVLINMMNADNTNLTICSSKWDDYDANVVCRSVGNAPLGKAKQMNGYNQNTTIPIDFYCNGNETSLDTCEHNFNNEECNILTTAAVICCKDGDTSLECSNSIPTQLSSSEFNVGLVLGLVIGLLLLAGIVIVTLIFIRRYVGLRKNKKTQHAIVCTNDYTGTQDIAMPTAVRELQVHIGLDKKVNNKQHPNSDRNRMVGDKESNVISHYEYATVDPTERVESTSNFEFDKTTGNNYFVLDPNETEFNRLEGPPNTTTSYKLANPIEDSGHRIYKTGIKINTDNLYARSDDGVYDSAQRDQYKEADSNVYSRTVDNVYDISSHTRENAETDDNYDHFTGNKTPDDYDISK